MAASLQHHFLSFFRHLVSPTTTINEISFTDKSIATVGNTSAVGGALGAVIAILTLLLVFSLVGMLYIYRRMKRSEGAVTTRKRTFSR